MAEVLIPLLPESWLPILAQALGEAAFIFASEARHTATSNIQRVIGTQASFRTVRRMFVHNAETYLSLFAARPRSFSLWAHELRGWDAFRQALEANRGCLLVSPHLGDLNYYAELFVSSGLGVNVLVEDLRPPAFRDLVVRLRARRGVKVIVGGPGALRQIYLALDRNEIVALISDRDVAGNGEAACFFGQRTTLPGVAFAIAERRQTPIVFGAAARLSDGRVKADVRPPFIPSGPIEQQVQQMASVFEEFIREFPEHWLALQPVWPAQGTTPKPRRAAQKPVAAHAGEHMREPRVQGRR